MQFFVRYHTGLNDNTPNALMYWGTTVLPPLRKIGRSQVHRFFYFNAFTAIGRWSHRQERTTIPLLVLSYLPTNCIGASKGLLAIGADFSECICQESTHARPRTFLHSNWWRVVVHTWSGSRMAIWRKSTDSMLRLAAKSAFKELTPFSKAHRTAKWYSGKTSSRTYLMCNTKNPDCMFKFHGKIDCWSE